MCPHIYVDGDKGLFGCMRPFGGEGEGSVNHVRYVGLEADGREQTDQSKNDGQPTSEQL